MRAKKNSLMVAEFDNPRELLHAAKSVRDAGYLKFETYSPFPIHGMDKAMRLKDSKLGWVVIVGALIGAIGGFSLQAWASTTAYRFVISGKPFLSAEAYVPVTFESMILFTGFTTFFGLFAMSKLPQFYHLIFKHKTFYKASSDGFFLSVDGDDVQFSEGSTMEFLSKLGGKNIEHLVEK